MYEELPDELYVTKSLLLAFQSILLQQVQRVQGALVAPLINQRDNPDRPHPTQRTKDNHMKI